MWNELMRLVPNNREFAIAFESPNEFYEFLKEHCQPSNGLLKVTTKSMSFSEFDVKDTFPALRFLRNKLQITEEGRGDYAFYKGTQNYIPDKNLVFKYSELVKTYSYKVKGAFPERLQGLL